jgi:hypothetical protein
MPAGIEQTFACCHTNNLLPAVIPTNYCLLSYQQSIACCHQQAVSPVLPANYWLLLYQQFIASIFTSKLLSAVTVHLQTISSLYTSKLLPPLFQQTTSRSSISQLFLVVH